MVRIVINANDDNRRLDKVLVNLLPKAGFGFLQKMMRKKNITLNGKKAHGADIVHVGDEVCLFFSDDTYEALCAGDDEFSVIRDMGHVDVDVVYEDRDILVINKPFGMLSQRVKKDDVSVNEAIRAYLYEKGDLSEDSFKEFRPSVVNRLDRNTGGLIIAAKNRPAATRLSGDIKNKRIRRIYNAIVSGKMIADGVFSAYYKKDEKDNFAILFDADVGGCKPIKTRFKTLNAGFDLSLIEAELYTGKSHQIRAMAERLGHPVINDEKYAKKMVIKGELPGQFLFAKTIMMPDGKIIDTPLPKEFITLLKAYGLEI